LELKNITLTVV